MPRFARILHDTAIEVLDAETLEGRFHPDLAAQFQTVPWDCEPGWVFDSQDGWGPPPPPAPVEPIWSFAELLDRMTGAEQLAAAAAASTDASVKLAWDRLVAANAMRPSGPACQALIAALVAASVLAPERAAEILSWGVA